MNNRLLPILSSLLRAAFGHKDSWLLGHYSITFEAHQGTRRSTWRGLELHVTLNIVVLLPPTNLSPWNVSLAMQKWVLPLNYSRDRVGARGLYLWTWLTIICNYWDTTEATITHSTVQIASLGQWKQPQCLPVGQSVPVIHSSNTLCNCGSAKSFTTCTWSLLLLCPDQLMSSAVSVPWNAFSTQTVPFVQRQRMVPVDKSSSGQRNPFDWWYSLRIQWPFSGCCRVGIWLPCCVTCPISKRVRSTRQPPAMGLNWPLAFRLIITTDVDEGDWGVSGTGHD